MIGKLRGIIDFIENNSIILDVNGIGYEIFCSANSLRKFPAEGEACSVYIHTHVREDNITLFGFYSKEEKKTFLQLNKVSGVGAKMALSILSSMSPSELANIIASNDKGAFKMVSGVGPKLAARLLTELKDKIHSTDIPVENNQIISNNNYNDAISALVNLGYNRVDAFKAINKIGAGNDNAPIDFLIKEGLKELGVK